MKKKAFMLFLTIFVISVSALVISYIFCSDRLTIANIDTNGNGKPDYRININVPKSVSLAKTGETNTKNRFLTERVLNFSTYKSGVQTGNLTVTLRQVNNRDYIYYFKYDYKNQGPELQAVIEALDANPKIKGRQLVYSNKISNTTSKWTSFDVTPGGPLSPSHALPKNAVFLDSPTHYLRLGLVDVFKSLKNRVRVEQFEKTKPITISSSGRNIRYTIPLPQDAGSFTETWGILGTSPLIDWQNTAGLAAAKRGDLVRYRKLSTDGIYYLTPNNYYPTEKTAFWLNPGYHVAELFSSQKTGQYFTDIAVASMYTAITAQNKEGYWVSYPRSDWLYHDYGIPEGFYDTRFNTDAALFLLHMYRNHGDTPALTAVNKYAGWLRNYVSSQGILTSGGGRLVPDYYKPGVPHKKTHVSLNHLVTEMNFLYELYLQNHDTRNLKTANLIRQAVRDTGRAWIKPDGNLHYAYLANGKYGMVDYPLITLNDLRLSQQLIQQVDKSRSGDNVFQMLINSKEEYLQKNKMPLK